MTFEEDVRNAVDCMKKGGIILYPTDTVWGLGCDASNPEAVERLFRLKERSHSKSMIVLVESEAMLERTVCEVPEIAWELIETAVNPLTVIYDSANGIAPGVASADGSIGVRITGERYSKELCRRMRGPVVSTSANISGKQTPALFREISEEVKDGVDYIASWRRDDDKVARPSNIIKLSAGGIVKVIR